LLGQSRQASAAAEIRTQQAGTGHFAIAPAQGDDFVAPPGAQQGQARTEVAGTGNQEAGGGHQARISVRPNIAGC
jgi:hypothetical protein